MKTRTIPESLSERLLTEVRRLKPAKCTPSAFDWSNGVRKDLPWIPFSFSPLYGQEIFDTLSEEQQICYNQYYSLQMVEQFIWVENYLTVLPVKCMLQDKQINPELKKILISLEEDEVEHNNTLWKLLQTAKPDLYPKPLIYNFLKPPSTLNFFISVMQKFPTQLYSWVFILSVFEEFALTLNRHYSQAEEKLDPLFRSIHTLHAVDEARHCNLDTWIANWLIDEESSLKGKFNAWMMKKCFTTYYKDWSLDLPIRHLIKDFPELANKFNDLYEGVRSTRGRDSRKEVFNKDVSPLTYKNRQSYPMFDKALQAIGAAPLA